MVTLKAHILPHHDLQPPGCRGSPAQPAILLTSVRMSANNDQVRTKTESIAHPVGMLGYI
ncbi:hypothetical protein HFK73_20135 [Escherichia coli]|uniref:hypothetical protein n=1 Tax=Escherichia coli TaxID=562 RepID=UPI001C47232E|nr:hypothetical protein [Escherichia coli]MBV7076652.1 hypothetical protein [Escherichia coli]